MNLERILPQGQACLFSKTENKEVWRIINLPEGVLNYLRIWLEDELISVAIDGVGMRNNTSSFHDEYLAHRIGLIPIDADPLRLEDLAEHNFDLCSERTCIAFELNVNNPGPGIKNVVSNDLVWSPMGNQAIDWQDRPPRPLYNDLLIARLYPGQEINLRAYAIRGTAREHAKWSAVFAHFRLIATRRPSILPQHITSKTPVLQPGVSRVNRNFIRYLANQLDMSEIEFIDMLQDPNYGNIAELTNDLNEDLRGLINPPLTQDEVRQLIEMTLASRVVKISTTLPPFQQLPLQQLPLQPFSLQQLPLQQLPLQQLPQFSLQQLPQFPQFPLQQLPQFPPSGSMMSQLGTGMQVPSSPRQSQPFDGANVSSEQCISCTELVKINVQPGFNCYYFTIELVGGLTFEDIDRQLQTRFNWNNISFEPVGYIF